MKARKPALHIQRATKREQAFYHASTEWPTLGEFLEYVLKVGLMGLTVFGVVKVMM